MKEYIVNSEEECLFYKHVELVRCKDCKHKPVISSVDNFGFRRYDFPDDRCPGQCDDWWYNWMPNDDWFCANGERADNEQKKSD